MFNKFFNLSIYFIIFFLLFISIFFIPLFNFNTYSSINNFVWPVQNHHKISSPFGYRTAPTTGASTFHSGIDIPAPPNTKVFCVLSGKVSFVGFKGAGGNTITIISNNYIISYCHLSSTFLVNVNDYVTSNQLIGYIGPKNIYDILNNPFKDKNGNPTNGATTGPHLHLTIKKEGTAIDPLSILKP